jgi:hypothetical protein
MSTAHRQSTASLGTTQDSLLLAFAPLHKAAFGAAVGTACALVVFSVTLLSLIRDPAQQFPLHLFRQYFAGYSVSWAGALIGALWAGFTGFVFGWFVAFVRNLMLAVSLFLIRTRAELAQTRDFLDHV